MSEREEVDVLADEIFSSIQAAQGQAFINDGWSGAETKAEFFEWLRTRQRWHDRAGQIFRDFFKKHGDEHRAALQKAKPLRHQSRARSWRTGYADGVERDGAIHALREMLKAYDAGALQMSSPEIGEPENNIPMHPWHEEFIWNARQALALIEQPARDDT